MNITRDNYEEIFMLYTDNELSAADCSRVEAFIATNPDLAEELVFFRRSKLQPDEKTVFPGKQGLLKQEAVEEAISLENYTSFFVLYGDDELDNVQKAQVEDFVYRHPQTQAEFEWLLQAKLAPDNSIVFENKTILYRKEEDDKVVPFRWWKLAVAAMVLLMAGAFWVYQSKNKAGGSELVTTGKSTDPKKVPVVKQSTTANTGTENSKEPELKEELALTDKTPAIQEVKRATNSQANYKKESRKNNGVQVLPQTPEQPELIADVAADKLKASNIPSIKKDNTPRVEVNKDLAAARSMPDQPMKILNPEEDNKMKADWASSSSSDNVEVLNTSVNTKNSMRGFFRKASRLIAKRTSLGNEEGNRKGILIGGFEIAVR
jgi:hypothetical protein